MTKSTRGNDHPAAEAAPAQRSKLKTTTVNSNTVSSKLSFLQNPIENIITKLCQLYPEKYTASHITTTTDDGSHNDVYNPTIISIASERQRLLNVKVPIGKLPPKYNKIDRIESRAAVLFEYTIRNNISVSNNNNSNSNNTGNYCQVIPTFDELGTVVSIKKIDMLRQLQQILLNYLTINDNTTTNTGNPIIKRPRGRPPELSKQNVVPILQNNNDTNSTSYVDTKDGIISSLTKTNDANTTLVRSTRATSNLTTYRNIITELSLKFVSHIRDPYTISKQAEQLFHKIQTYYDTDTDNRNPTNAEERRAHIYDLQRYNYAYQAATFYFVVMKANKLDALERKKGRGKGVKKNMKLHSNEDNDDDDGGENEADSSNNNNKMKVLTIMDLVYASNDLTFLELKQVMPHVHKLATTIMQQQDEAEAKRKQEDESKRKQQPRSIGDGITKQNSSKASNKNNKNLSTTIDKNTGQRGRKRKVDERKENDTNDNETISTELDATTTASDEKNNTAAASNQSTTNCFGCISNEDILWRYHILEQVLQQQSTEAESNDDTKMLITEPLDATASKTMERNQKLAEAAEAILVKYGIIQQS